MFKSVLFVACAHAQFNFDSLKDISKVLDTGIKISEGINKFSKPPEISVQGCDCTKLLGGIYKNKEWSTNPTNWMVRLRGKLDNFEETGNPNTPCDLKCESKLANEKL